MLTGISGSYTVEIASTIPGLSASVRAASGTTADRSSAPGAVFGTPPSGSDMMGTGGTSGIVFIVQVGVQVAVQSVDSVVAVCA
jgi:hypothetical protein